LKTFLSITLCLFSFAVMAADIDGKWNSERKMERDGQSFTIKQTYDFKTSGNKLTGSMTMQFGDMEPRSMEISDGKVEGNKFSFATTMRTPNGDFKMTYEGTVEGGTIKGTISREGGEPRPFEAKRSAS
jgi:hypothetical protein